MINRGENQFPKIQGTVNNFNQANEGGNVSEQSLFTQISQPPSGSINPTNAIAAPQIKQSLQKPYTIPFYPVSTIDAFEQAEKAKTKDERPETLASNIKVAEASKSIENAQRDVNISFVNELAQLAEIALHRVRTQQRRLCQRVAGNGFEFLF